MNSFLIVSIALFVLWLGVLFISHKTRREQLVMSVVGLLMTPPALLMSLADFRHAIEDGVASIGIEDFIFAFSLFGIAAVIYQVIFGKHVRKMRGAKVGFKNGVVNWIAKLVLVMGIWIITAMTLIALFEVLSIHAFIIAGIMIGIYIIAERHDLLLNALFSAVFIALLVFVLEVVLVTRLYPEYGICIWDVQFVTHYLFAGVPLEDVLWSGVIGFTIGPLYEYLRHYRLV
jgi:hypothetical protein